MLKIFLISGSILLVSVATWAGLTKAGFIPNYLDLEILCGKEDEEDFYFGGGYGENITIDKPVIYLYPETRQDVLVELDYQGKLIADYPEYNEKIGGWNIRANPDGSLLNYTDNKEYSYIFWEGESAEKTDWDLSTGFVIAGKDTVSFLQNILPELGLTPKEYNEFIVYWYPRMMNNSYNLIHFAHEQYTETAPLTVTPTPDSLLRVFMVYKPLTEKIEIPAQEIPPFERKGFAVIEWGGAEI